MKRIGMYLSADGETYPTKEEALIADARACFIDAANSDPAASALGTVEGTALLDWVIAHRANVLRLYSIVFKTKRPRKPQEDTSKA